MHLTLSFLGPFQAKVDDQPIAESRSKKIEALLVYLAMEATVAHRRETLVGLLFPDLPDDAARMNLRQTLTRLRRAIKDAKASPSFLLTSREATQFNSDANATLDVQTFERLLRGCEGHHPHLDSACERCIARLEEAVALYRGPFLDGFFIEDGLAFDDWILAHRQNYHQRAVSALTAVSDFYEARGEYETAQRFTERLLVIEPWDEAVQRQLLRLLAYQGKRNVALARYEAFKSQLYEELGVEPVAETRRLQQQIVGMSNERPYNIPPRNHTIIDRENDQAALLKQINNPNTRLITLTGPGGMGKTRLAVEVAWRTAKSFLGPFLHGTFFVPLAEIAPDESNMVVKNSIVIAIAESLQFSFSGASPPDQQLLTYLQDKSLLLLLDNFENIADSGREVVHQIIQQAPQVKLLITSRERLNLATEWVYPLEGLSLPSEAAEFDRAETFGAVKLFVQRARQTNPHFELTDEGSSINRCSRETAVKICQRLYGSPLAIELAAPWVRLLSGEEILQEISDSFDALTTDVHQIPPRHRSIRNVFTGSWNLLSSDEQTVAQNLSLFRGGFDRLAAKQVASASIVSLGKLLDKSFLRQMNPESEHGRYQMQELLRQYCEEKRLAAPQAIEQDEKYSRYYLTFLRDKSDALKGHGQIEALAAITQEKENIRRAWRVGLDQQLYDWIGSAAEPLTLYFYMRSWFTEGETLFGEAVMGLEQDGTGAETAVLHSDLQARQGWFAFLLGKQDEGIQLLKKSRSALETQGAPSLFATSFLAAALQITGKLNKAHETAQLGLEQASALKDKFFTAVNNNILSQIAYQRGEFETARDHCRTSLAIEEALGNRWSMGFSLTNLGRFAYAVGEYAQARAHFEESLAIRQTMNDTRGQALCYNYLGDTLQVEKAYQEALLKYQAALLNFQKINSPSGMASSLVRLGHLSIDLKEWPTAQSYFQEALEYAQTSHAIPSLLSALLGLGRLRVDESPAEAIAIAALIENHPAASPDSKRRAKAFLNTQEVSAQNEMPSLSLKQALLLVSDNGNKKSHPI